MIAFPPRRASSPVGAYLAGCVRPPGAASLPASVHAQQCQQQRFVQLKPAESPLPITPELSAALSASEKQIATLTRERAAKVAELTRLSEVLADARARRAMAEAEADALQKAHDAHVSRRSQVQRRLEESAARVDELRQRCVAAQAKTPEPIEVDRVVPEVQPLRDKAMKLDVGLAEFDGIWQQRNEQRADLAQRCKVEEQTLEVEQRNLALLDEVYERSDRLMQDLDNEAEEKGVAMDPEQIVLALAAAANPQMHFGQAVGAIAQLRRMAKVLGPQAASSNSQNARPTSPGRTPMLGQHANPPRPTRPVSPSAVAQGHALGWPASPPPQTRLGAS